MYSFKTLACMGEMKYPPTEHTNEGNIGTGEGKSISSDMLYAPKGTEKDCTVPNEVHTSRMNIFFPILCLQLWPLICMHAICSAGELKRKCSQVIDILLIVSELQP